MDEQAAIALLEAKGYTVLPPSQGGSSFAEFWAKYPRKVGKPQAQKAFERNPREQPAILAGLIAHLEAKAFTDDIKYIPHPSTWLNQKRWADKPMPKQTFQKPQVGGVSKTRAALDAWLGED